jgi:renalase
MKMHDVMVIGAGVAGLQCARRLKSAGADALVLDRSDKPGGRCATRTFEGAPADYGAVFVHGDHPGFLAALQAVDGPRVEGWPMRVHGRGMPCQPDAFAPFETRFAFAEGVNVFPRALAEGLPIRFGSLVSSVAVEQDGISVALASGEKLQARNLVLAMALEQSVPLLRMLEPAERMRGILGVLEMFASTPCLTVIAGYDANAPMPDWDIAYPEDEPALLLVSNESSKRPGGPGRVLVFQASARWSRERLERPKEESSRELLEIAARYLGSWAGVPRWTHPHRWKYSRLDKANELAGPVDMEIGTSRIGIIGDLFSPGGGLQAAWLSGDRLGDKLGGKLAGA